MTFPPGHLDSRVEMLIDGVWSNITGDVYERDQIQISRGIPNEGSTISPARASLTLDNRTGKYSPRNPTGSLYGKIGRNTQVRVSVPGRTVGLDVNGASLGASAPDSTQLSITGDVDLRINMSLPWWPAAKLQGLVGKYGISQWSYSVYIGNDSYLRLQWTTDGTNATNQERAATIPFPASMVGRYSIRATLDVNNGAGGNTVTFYTSPDTNLSTATWTQFGAAVTAAGVTSVYDSTATARIGGQPNTTAAIYSAEIRSGIGGTVVANPNFTVQTAGASSFADTAVPANTWTIAGGSPAPSVTAILRIRMVGEIATFPQGWDVTGIDRYAQIEAAGILRRLGQGQAPLRSLYYRNTMRTLSGTLVAYWPAEDGMAATSLGSALAGGSAMTLTMPASDGTALSSYDGFPASEPIPTVGSSRWTGRIGSYTSTNQITMRAIMYVPAGTVPNNTVLFSLSTNTARWDVQYGTGGDLELVTYDSAATFLATSGDIAFGVDSKRLLLQLTLSQSGGNMAWDLSTLVVGDFTGSSAISGSVAGTVGRATQVVVNRTAAATSDLAIGHIYVIKEALLALSTETLNGYQGETATDRIVRLCGEEGISLVNLSAGYASTALGPQPTATLLDILQEAAAADGGLLYESREILGLAWRSRTTLYHQAPTVTLDYAAHQMTGLNPVEDDINTRNDITVSRVAGGSARQVKTSGPLSTASPPSGVGIYDDAVTINVATDDALDDQAGWRLNLGTVDEPRFPGLTVDMGNTAMGAVTDALLDLDIGDRFVVSHPLTGPIAPDDISQVFYGLSEVIGAFTWTQTLTGVPESPYRVGVYSAAVVSGGGQSKYSSDGTTLTTGYNSTATSFVVTTPTGPLWTTDASQHPREMIVAGERVTVTATTGTTNPQTFTVTRSVNGVVKAQVSGASIVLFTPPRAKYGL